MQRTSFLTAKVLLCVINLTPGFETNSRDRKCLPELDEPLAVVSTWNNAFR